MAWMLLSNIRPGMVLNYGIVNKDGVIIKSTTFDVKVDLYYYKKTYPFKGDRIRMEAN